jgi:hypothetical protein
MQKVRKSKKKCRFINFLLSNIPVHVPCTMYTFTIFQLSYIRVPYIFPKYHQLYIFCGMAQLGCGMAQLGCGMAQLGCGMAQLGCGMAQLGCGMAQYRVRHGSVRVRHGSVGSMSSYFRIFICITHTRENR